MCKSDTLFPYLQSTALLEWLLKFRFIKFYYFTVYQKMNDSSSGGKVSVNLFHFASVKEN